MAVPQFKSTTDLVVYLGELEKRIADLENENGALRNAVNKASQDSFDARDRARFLPETGLLSRSFMTRAFTVWGHYFVAQLIISLGLFVIYLIIFLVFLAGAPR